MSQLTVLESRDFWDELRKRSEIADAVGQMYGERGLREIVATAFEVKQEYEETERRSTVEREGGPHGT